MTSTTPSHDVYQGQFGEFTLTEADFWGVRVYRGSLAIAALAWAIGCGWVLATGRSAGILDGLFAIFAIALGVSLATIHIYLKPLHRSLQVFWGIGVVFALVVGLRSPAGLVSQVYVQPISLFGIGFLFAALTGIYFKEAFCFGRLETQVLTPLVPILLLGHLFGILPVGIEKILLGIWALLFVIFALRKLIQAMPDDVGDKSVFDYLKQQGSKSAA
jgi:uncharacterized integral membrane protein